MKFRESNLAHKYLDGLKGIEIGGAAHNPFGLNTLNVDVSNDYSNVYKRAEISNCGELMKVDIISNGDSINLPSESLDFIISSHVFEHFYNPIKVLIEWFRLIKVGGYVFMIIPHKDRTFDRGRGATPIKEFKNIYESNKEPIHIDCHHHAWITQDAIDLVNFMNKNLYFKAKIIESKDVDDKVGNGFTILLQKI